MNYRSESDRLPRGGGGRKRVDGARAMAGVSLFRPGSYESGMVDGRRIESAGPSWHASALTKPGRIWQYQVQPWADTATTPATRQLRRRLLSTARGLVGDWSPAGGVSLIRALYLCTHREFPTARGFIRTVGVDYYSIVARKLLNIHLMLFRTIPSCRERVRSFFMSRGRNWNRCWLFDKGNYWKELRLTVLRLWILNVEEMVVYDDLEKIRDC